MPQLPTGSICKKYHNCYFFVHRKKNASIGNTESKASLFSSFINLVWRINFPPENSKCHYPCYYLIRKNGSIQILFFAGPTWCSTNVIRLSFRAQIIVYKENNEARSIKCLVSLKKTCICTFLRWYFVSWSGIQH